MNKLIEAARLKPTETILACLKQLTGPQDTEARMVRAALIEVYAERCGLEAADLLMDELGL